MITTARLDMLEKRIKELGLAKEGTLNLSYRQALELLQCKDEDFLKWIADFLPPNKKVANQQDKQEWENYKQKLTGVDRGVIDLIERSFNGV